jgi:hypothetical protein
LLRDCDGADKVSDDPGRIAVDVGLLAGLLAGRRACGRELDVVFLGRDEVDLGLAIPDCPEPDMPMDMPWPEPAISAEPADLEARDAVRELGRVDADLGRADGLRLLVVRDVPVREVPVRDALARDVVFRAVVFRAVVFRAVPVLDVPVLDVPVLDAAVLDVLVLDVPAVRLAGAAAGFTVCIVLAAAVRAFAAVDIALVAVFIARMADDIVLADAVALVAAAVILLAADVTLVAADETVFAAVAGVADVLLAVVRSAVVRPAARVLVLRVPVLRVPVLRPAEVRLVVLRPVVRRAAVEREEVERDAVDRDAELRVGREVVLRAEAPAADLVVRVPLAEALDDLELDVDGRLAVPFDALRLTDLLRAELAELRRVAARVVD